MFNNLLKRNKNKKKKGFTLIELIIVIAIIIIISAIAIPNLSSVRDNSKNKTDVASCGVIKRSTLALVAGDQVKAPASGSKTVTFDKGGTGATIAYSQTNNVDDWTTDEKTAFTDSIKDVKAPQGKVFTGSSDSPSYASGAADAKRYQVTIDHSGDVTVVTLEAATN